MMKTRNLLLLGLIGLGMMTACSNEDGVENGNEPNSNEKAYTTLTFTIANSSSAGTRAANPTTGTASDKEADLQSVALVLATDDDKVIASYSLTAADFDTPTTNANGGKTYKMKSPIETTTGLVKVYAFVNPTGLTFTTGEPVNRQLTVEKNTTTGKSNKFGSIANDGSSYNAFLMANTKEVSTSLLAVTATDDEWEKVEGWSKGEEKVNSVTVEVERLVSKVTFSANTTVTDNTFEVKQGNTTIAKAVVKGANIINLNTKTNLLKQGLYWYGEDGTDYSKLFYVTDPNYTTVLEYKTLDQQTAANNYIAENFAQTYTTEFYQIGTSTASGTTAREDALYCLENTMAADAQQNGQTTGAIYQVEYQVENAGISSIGGEEGTTVATNYNFVVNQSDIVTDKSTFWNKAADVKTFYAYNELIFGNKNAAVLYKLLTEQGNTTLTSDNYADFKSSYETEIQKDAPADIDIYKDGICYYTAWIMHNTAAVNDYMALGKYGVVRNHWYDLTVNSINGLGTLEPTIPGTPDQPDDKVKAKIEVEVSLVPWRYIQQSVDLE